MHPLVALAKTAVENYITAKKTVTPPVGLDKKFLAGRSGAFVSLHQNGELRGCVGTYMPTRQNIAKEVIANAINAATGDPRFEPIEKKDLPELKYEVYVLYPPEPVASMDGLDPKTYGVIVLGVKTKRSALLLPDLEGIDTVAQQLGCVTRKAGIDPTRETIAVQKFRADIFRQ